MSRVGKYPVVVPSGVTVTINENVVTAKGKRGEMKYTFDANQVSTKLEDGKVWVRPLSEDRRARALWGTTRSRINNLVKGVSEGFVKKLEIVGVGYKARVQGKSVVLSLGFSHDVEFPVPAGIEIKCESPTSLEVSGADKHMVGQVASKIRGYRPPEPYKGKGIKYVGETILRKEGKKK